MATYKRKKKTDPERLAMRVPAELKAKYARAAALRGETFSGWAKNVLDEAAERQLREHEFLNMTLRDRTAFVEAVLSPAEPNEALLKAAKRYKKVLGL